MRVSVRVSRTAVAPGGAAPTFTVRTNRALCEVQLASDPILFTGAAAGRRSPANFAGLRAPVRGGQAAVTPDAQTWAALSRFPHVPYRAIAHDGTPAAPLRGEATVSEFDYSSAPTVYVGQSGRAPVRLERPLSARLRWLQVRANRIEDDAGDPVVLRGVVRDGMATTEPVGIDPEGVGRTTTREVAGITGAEIREIVRRWGANVIRVPFNQEWALTRPDYVAGLDRIIGWAAAEGAYTLLALERLDLRRKWGSAGGIAPLPEENTVRAWTALANRYRKEPAVLFELYSLPHRAAADDTDFVLERPPTEAAWVTAWHAWVRRLAVAIEREHGRALLFVSGWNLGRELASFPVALGGGRYVRALYTVRADSQAFASMPADVDRMLAAPALPRRAPLFVSRWGGGAADVAWGAALESELRTRHRFRDGAWPGVAGWTAASWGDEPPLVERTAASRVVGGRVERWRPFVMDGGERRVTEFGELVRGALRTAPFAASSDFDAARAAGQRSRFRVTASPARVGDFFVLYGHDLAPGSVVEFTPTGRRAPVIVAARAIGGFMLLVDELPDTVPRGQVTVAALRPDGVRSDPVALRVEGGQPAAQLTLMPGPAKARPYTIVLMANPWVESEVGANVLADPIHGQRALFARSVGTVVEALFGLSERLLRDYAHEIRVVVRFAPAPRSIDNALCHEIFAPYMEPVPQRVRAFLAALPLPADICFLIYGTGARNLSSAFFSFDDRASAALPFDLDGRAGHHRRATQTPGTVAQAAPPSDDVVALHEFLHAIGDQHEGTLVDLYDEALPGAEVVNKKRRPRPGPPVPPAFKTLDGVAYAAALQRDGPRLVYPVGAQTYHGARVVPGEPNVMDNYFMASSLRLPRLDTLTLRFLRDRLEWKLGR